MFNNLSLHLRRKTIKERVSSIFYVGMFSNKFANVEGTPTRMIKYKVKRIRISCRDIIHSCKVFSLRISNLSKFCVEGVPKLFDSFVFDSFVSTKDNTKLRMVVPRRSGAVFNKIVLT